MSITTIPMKRRTHGRLYDALWKRQLTSYPSTARRMAYLGIVVLTTIVLYYLYYVEGAVTPLMLPYYHMSFLYFLYLLVVSNAIGAFTAFIGGLSDKVGRANLTIYGTLTVGLVQLVAVPHIHSEFGFAVAYCVIGFVEGIILVSTPALIRDFSPQMGRAQPWVSGHWGRRSAAWRRAWSPPGPWSTSTRGRTSSSSRASCAWGWCSSPSSASVSCPHSSATSSWCRRTSAPWSRHGPRESTWRRPRAIHFAR